MEEKADPGAEDEVFVEEGGTLALLDSGKPRVPSLAFNSLPRALLSVVGEYLSDDKDDPVKYALLDEQPITFCLSQDVHSKMASCLELGFLPPERQLKKMDFVVDKEYLVTNHEGCLQFFDSQKPRCCRVVIDVLVMKLSLTSRDSTTALSDFRNAIGALQKHLRIVKHVVISISEYASYCFSLHNPIDKATGLPQLCHRLQVLHHIIDDLGACWKENQTLDVCEFFDFYFTNGAKPASEKYLEKFVISIDHRVTRTLFKRQAVNMVSDKIMWVYRLKSFDDFDDIDQDATRLCQVVDLDAMVLELANVGRLHGRLKQAFEYEGNRYVERIVIRNGISGQMVQLPRPFAPLTLTTPPSALIEISLEGISNSIHLTQLNKKGYFPNLVHLSIIGGLISGHLDSQCVPRLKTLVVDLTSSSKKERPAVCALVNEHCRSLIISGRPWQLVATQARGGWSLASYDELITNPQDEVKHDVPLPFHLQPLIKDLLLVMSSQLSANQWQTQLEGGRSLEADANDHDDPLLVWVPERVEKIIVFGTSDGEEPRLTFQKEIFGHVRHFTSLTCHHIEFYINGDVLPKLQSLEVNGSVLMSSGAFPLLKTLSLDFSRLQSDWRVDAPLLQSFSCCDMCNGGSLLLYPSLQPDLSYLRIKTWYDHPQSNPKITLVVDHWGLSRVKHVVLGVLMRSPTCLDVYQLHDVLHLELALEAFKFPAPLFSRAFNCETLTFKFSLSSIGFSSSGKMVLPALPRVQKLVVMEDDCELLLNHEMPSLTECTLAAPRSLGANVKCPVLDIVRFTGKLSESEKMKCLDQATYAAIGAQPSEIIFDSDGESHKMSCDVAPKKI